MGLIETLKQNKYLILFGLFIGLLILIVIIFQDIYKLQIGMEILWNRTESCGLIQ